MCATSVIGDQWNRTYPNRYPGVPYWPPIIPPAGPTRDEFDALRREVSELKELLKAAKRFDEQTGQADCEQDEKIALLRKVAKLVGVDLDDVFGPEGAA